MTISRTRWICTLGLLATALPSVVQAQGPTGPLSGLRVTASAAQPKLTDAVGVTAPRFSMVPDMNRYFPVAFKQQPVTPKKRSWVARHKVITAVIIGAAASSFLLCILPDGGACRKG